jgi:tRNA-specific 2-thiouridylase
VLAVDRAAATVVVGDETDLLDGELTATSMSWVDEPVGGEVLVQTSAHGTPHPATVDHGGDGAVRVAWHQPQRRVAAGQSVVLYDLADREVLGGGIATR